MSLIDDLLAKIKVLQDQYNALYLKQPTSLQPLVKRQADLVIKKMTELGHKVTVFQGFRSFAEQDALYSQGRTTPGSIVTNARGGDSLHQYGVAIDVVFLLNGRPSWDNALPWAELGRIGKLYGFEWGGSPEWIAAGMNDRPHLQLTMGYTLQQFKNKQVDYNRYV